MDLIKALVADSRIASHGPGPPNPDGRCVLYWMRRAQRAFDNPALEATIGIAHQLKLPVAVCFFLRPHRPYANLRQFAFMLEGLADTAARLERRKIGFILRRVDRHAAAAFGQLCEELRPAVIVTDRNPLTPPDAWRKLIPSPVRAPSFSVAIRGRDLPTALIGREHYAARTIRPLIHRGLDMSFSSPRRAIARCKCRGPHPGQFGRSFRPWNCLSRYRSVALSDALINSRAAPLTVWLA